MQKARTVMLLKPPVVHLRRMPAVSVVLKVLHKDSKEDLHLEATDPPGRFPIREANNNVGPAIIPMINLL